MRRPPCAVDNRMYNCCANAYGALLSRWGINRLCTWRWCAPMAALYGWCCSVAGFCVLLRLQQQLCSVRHRSGMPCQQHVKKLASSCGPSCSSSTRTSRCVVVVSSQAALCIYPVAHGNRLCQSAAHACLHLLQAERALADSHRAVGAFVTFREEAGKMACLRAQPHSRMRQLLTLRPEHKLRGRCATQLEGVSTCLQCIPAAYTRHPWCRAYASIYM